QQWVQQNVNENYPLNINKILIIDDNTWVVKNPTKIYKTTDQGLSFVDLLADDLKDVDDIYLYNNKLIVLYNMGDKVLRTMISYDLGNTFQELNTYLTGLYIHSNIISETFTDDMHGWVLQSGYKHTLSRTTDGGRTWAPGLQTFGIDQIHFKDSLNGIYIAYNTNFLVRTTNGGIWWDKVYFPDSLEIITTNIIYIDSVLYIYKYYYNEDSTSTLTYNYRTNEINTIDSFPLPIKYIGTTIIKSNNTYINYVPNSNYFLQISNNKGKTWDRYNNPALDNRLYSFLPNGSIVAFGENGSIYKSNDNGINWRSINKGSVPASEIHFIKENGWIAGGNILKTINGGKEWKFIYTKFRNKKIYFINENIGFSFAKDNEPYERINYNGYFLKTTDGGYNWDTLHIINKEQKINNILFKDNNGYVLGNDLFYKTTDGGNTWSYDDNSNISGNKINFISNNIGFISNDSIGYKTTDGGEVWVSDTLFKGENIFFIDEKIGFKSFNRKLLKTIDGGINWTENPNRGLNSSRIKSINFINDSVGFVSYIYNIDGESFYYIIKSTDQGNSWISLRGDDAINYYTSFFIGKNLGWKANSHGEIFKYTDEVTTSTKNENLISHYSLSQNYPNPFNPNTTIRYSIPKQNFVSLKIYDVLGNEVAQIVNEEKPAGKYEVSFNASGLSSGVYFYRINSGEFSQVKKLLLLK
ncbi:MAG: YCF48-related protein, partial [Syntrophothermus sp.]